MNIHGIPINLEAIGISFTPNDEQVKALDHLVDFIKSDKLTTVLSGSAGTGKTSIIKILLQYLKMTSRREVTLAAPTHKAKMILSRLSNKDEATTLHKLLQLKPDVKLLEFDVKDIKFMDQLACNLFEDEDDLIIIDEASMINDSMFDLLIDRMDGIGKIIFLGDAAQIQPVKQGFLSKVFDKTDFPGFNLTRVERQQGDNPLLDTLLTLREKPMGTFYSKIADGKGLQVYIDAKPFASALKNSFPDVRALIKKPFENKIITYTNRRANDFNELVRRILKVDHTMLSPGEIMMAHDTYAPNMHFPTLYNGTEYVVISVKKSKKSLPFYAEVEGYDLKLLDTVEAKNAGDLSVIKHVFLIDPNYSDAQLTRLAYTIEKMRLDAVNAKTGYSKKTYWASWYKLKDSFITMKDMYYQGRGIKKMTINYGYSITTHKSQGSTYDNVFVDMKNILACPDKNELRQMQYVALSRASKMVHLLN